MAGLRGRPAALVDCVLHAGCLQIRRISRLAAERHRRSQLPSERSRCGRHRVGVDSLRMLVAVSRDFY